MSWLNTAAGMDLHERLVDRFRRAGLPSVQAETAANVVFQLLTNVRRDVDEVDVTTFASPEREVLWHRTLAADLELVVDTGRYTTPLHTGWTAIP